MATNGGYDLYNMVGRKYKYPNTLDDIFNNHYLAVAEKYILLRGVSDVILRKMKHHIELLEFSTDFHGLQDEEILIAECLRRK